MNATRIQLVLYSTNRSALDRYRQLTLSLPNLIVQQGSGPEVHRKIHLDAIWVPVMMAVDWGAPAFTIPRRLAFETPAKVREKGLPGWFVTGGVTERNEALTSIRIAELLLEELTKGARELSDRTASSQITIGATPETIGLDKLTASEAESVLSAALTRSTQVHRQSQTRLRIPA